MVPNSACRTSSGWIPATPPTSSTSCFPAANAIRSRLHQSAVMRARRALDWQKCLRWADIFSKDPLTERQKPETPLSMWVLFNFLLQKLYYSDHLYSSFVNFNSNRYCFQLCMFSLDVYRFTWYQYNRYCCGLEVQIFRFLNWITLFNNQHLYNTFTIKTTTIKSKSSSRVLSAFLFKIASFMSHAK